MRRATAARIQDQLFIEPSFSSLMAKARATDVTLACNASFARDHGNQRDPFYGMVGPIAQVCETLLGGWPEGVDKIKKAREGLRLPPVASIRRKVRFGPQGDELDIHAVRNGRLERAWRSTPRAQYTGPGRVHVIVNIGGRASVPTASLHWRGVAALALSEALTKAGYNVKISSIWTTLRVYEGDEADQKWHTVLTTVKPYTAPLNVTALAGLLAHPAAYRRVHFCHLITQARQGKLRETLGYSQDPNLAKVKELIPALAQDNVPIVLVPLSLLDEGKVIAWLSQSVKSIGRH